MNEGCIQVGSIAPDFEATAVYDQDFENVQLSSYRGKKYVINNSSHSGHPLYIKTVGGAGTGNQYSSGVTGQGSVKVTFEVPMDAPKKLFYQCSIHAAMQGEIFIADPEYGPDSADVNTLADARIAAASINDLSDVMMEVKGSVSRINGKH